MDGDEQNENMHPASGADGTTGRPQHPTTQAGNPFRFFFTEKACPPDPSARAPDPVHPWPAPRLNACPGAARRRPSLRPLPGPLPPGGPAPTGEPGPRPRPAPGGPAAGPGIPGPGGQPPGPRPDPRSLVHLVDQWVRLRPTNGNRRFAAGSRPGPGPAGEDGHRRHRGLRPRPGTGQPGAGPGLEPGAPGGLAQGGAPPAAIEAYDGGARGALDPRPAPTCR